MIPPWPAMFLATRLPPQAATPPDWAVLQRRGAIICEIKVDPQDVFNLTNPDENTWLGRGATSCTGAPASGSSAGPCCSRWGSRSMPGASTRPSAWLRSLAFIKDARIDPGAAPRRQRGAHVWVRDAWTLKVSGGFQQVGGQHSSGLGIQEQNLMGTGKTVAFTWSRDPAQSSGTYAYADPQLFGSTWTLNTQYQNLSNGSARALDLERPFISLDTLWSVSDPAQVHRFRPVGVRQQHHPLLGPLPAGQHGPGRRLGRAPQ